MSPEERVGYYHAFAHRNLHIDLVFLRKVWRPLCRNHAPWPTVAGISSNKLFEQLNKTEGSARSIRRY